jgi:hypothetical protein
VGIKDADDFLKRLDSGALKKEERAALLAGNAFFSAMLMSVGMPDNPAVKKAVKESFDTAMVAHIAFFKAQPGFPGFPPGFPGVGAE